MARRSLLAPALLALALLLPTACSGGDEVAGGDPSLTVPYGGDWPTTAAEDVGDVARASSGADAAATDGGAAGGGAAGDDVLESAGTAPGAAEPLAGAPEPPAPAGPLRGGSVDDNDRFVDYLAYRERALATGIAVHDRDVRERHVVRVRTAAGAPVLGARVALLLDGREVQSFLTRSDGRAVLHPLAVGAPATGALELRASLGDARASLPLEDRAVREHTLTLDVGALESPTPLDVHFLIDATGSMGDEIDRLKATMADVAARITALDARPAVRWGLTAYRDRGDAFVTRAFDFTDDLGAFTAELAKVEADGGGDDPEALNEALHAAVHGPAWRPEEAVRILFLLADAPPHLDYPDDHDYAEEMLRAAERGIAIVPIASSGTGDQAEYVFRQLAQTTLGRFLFLTYGPDGQPGDGTAHDVGPFEAQSLDELVVRYVAEQLAHLEARPAQQ
jgi:hypothetical protein